MDQKITRAMRMGDVRAALHDPAVNVADPAFIRDALSAIAFDASQTASRVKNISSVLRTGGRYFLPVPDPRFATRIAPFRFTDIAAGGGFSAPDTVNLPRQSWIYGFGVVFVNAAGAIINPNVRVEILLGDRYPLIAQDLASLDTFQGSSSATMMGFDVDRMWILDPPRQVRGLEQVRMRIQNNSPAVISRGFGVVVYGERSADLIPDLGLTESRRAVIVVPDIAANQGPFSFEFQRPSRITGFSGRAFVNDAADPNNGLFSLLPVRLRLYYANNDNITTDFVLDHLLFGSRGTQVLTLPHRGYTGSKGSVLVEFRRDAFPGAVPILGYMLEAHYDEPLEPGARK